MIQYISTRGGQAPVSFDEAVLRGFAGDGGLFVPQTIPRISRERLKALSGLSYTDLAFEILSLFIDPDIIPAENLRQLIRTSFAAFEHPDILPLKPLGTDPSVLIMELFHGPTLSFKDIAMGFLINTMEYLLEKRGEHLTLVLATTGDTGPAAAHAAAGKKTIDCWPLYPKGMITREQERQMTTLEAANVHPVGVENCPDGGDDIDLVVARLFADKALKQRLNLSSVNSINWCRVMVQSIHYFYGYFQACNTIGDPVIFSVPSGACGNLFAGHLAKAMGLPVTGFICANNANKTLHTAFSTGVFKKEDLQQTLSSAIDIVVPYNFWRFLYFTTGCDPKKVSAWMDQFQKTGEIRLDPASTAAIGNQVASVSISDAQTLDTIRNTFAKKDPYLLDPHGAVAVAAAAALKNTYSPGTRIICLATAHPAKFSRIMTKALGPNLPDQAFHPSLIRASQLCQHLRTCECDHLESALVHAMDQVAQKKREPWLIIHT
ncbi:MAG: threonine synthase [Proteobacteria bacterium]|nr:threonine synthase [Pseudomonadota bacterium]